MRLINAKLTIAILIGIGLTACSPDKTSSEYIAQAKSNIASNNNNEAIIELKNAIRGDLTNPEARFMLGSLYLNNGQSVAAEKELKQALKLGFDENLVIPKLLKTYNLQDKHQETLALVQQHPALKDNVKPVVFLYEALAQGKLGETEVAKSIIEQANELSSDSVFSRFGSAFLQANAENIDETLTVIDQLLTEEPELSEALLLKGQLLSIKKDYSGAISAFNAYFKQLPQDLKIRLFLANAYIRNEQFNDADKHLDHLIQLLPEHPFINQLKGIIHFQNNNYEAALAHTNKAIQNGLDISANKIIAGLSAFNLEQYEQAHQNLVGIKGLLESNHPVKRILAATQIKLGYADEASSTIASLGSLTEADANLLTTASFELIKSGQIEKAKNLLSKTSDIVGDSSQERMKLGILQLSMDDLEGITNLEKAVTLAPEAPLAKVTLAAAYIKNKQYDKAINLAKKWQEESPQKVEGYNLLAKALFLKNTPEAAEKELQKSLSINPNNAYALLYYSDKYFRNNDTKNALLQINKLLSSSPNHISALVQHYRINTFLGTPELSIIKIKTSYNNNPQNIVYRLLYARALFTEKNYSEAIKLLNEYAITTSETPDLYWQILAKSYHHTNQKDKSLTTYNDWIDKKPNSKQAWLSKISQLELNRDISSALSTVKLARIRIPDDLQLKILLISFFTENKQFEKAQKEINKLNDNEKSFSLVKGLQGKIWLTQSEFDKALPNLIELYKVQSSSKNALFVTATYKAMNRKQDAFEFLKAHQKKQPKEKFIKVALAELAMDFDQKFARESYLNLLKSEPKNGSLLNNLAWVEYLLGNYNSADNYATQALSVLGNHPQVLDTAGQIKIKMGLKTEGITLLEKAQSLSPNNAEITQHLKQAKGL